MKKRLFLLSLLMLGTQVFASSSNSEIVNIDAMGSNLEENLLFNTTQLDFVNSVKEKLERNQKEFEKFKEKYKAEVEANAAIINRLKDRWNHEIYVGVEENINSDDNWKFKQGSLATGPYVGYLLYKDNSKILWDAQYAKTFFDNTKGFNRSRFSIGATYRDAFKLESGKNGNYSLRLGYRNDNYNYSFVDDVPMFYNLTGEQRNEIWVRPSVGLNLTPKLRISTTLSFRFINRELNFETLYGEGPRPPLTAKQTSVNTRDWGNIQEHLVGARYTFDNRDFVSLDYMFYREDLPRIIGTTENFAVLKYYHAFSNKDAISPYIRMPLADGKQKFYSGHKGDVIEIKGVRAVYSVRRPRLGIQYKHNFTQSTSVLVDVNYRPLKMPSFASMQDFSNPAIKTERQNFFMVFCEFAYRF